MYNKLKATLITILIILIGIGVYNTVINYPNETRYTVLVIMIGGWIYWIYKLILNILEDNNVNKQIK